MRPPREPKIQSIQLHIRVALLELCLPVMWHCNPSSKLIAAGSLSSEYISVEHPPHERILVLSDGLFRAYQGSAWNPVALDVFRCHYSPGSSPSTTLPVADGLCREPFEPPKYLVAMLLKSRYSWYTSRTSAHSMIPTQTPISIFM